VPPYIVTLVKSPLGELFSLTSDHVYLTYTLKSMSVAQLARDDVANALHVLEGTHLLAKQTNLYI
jgi:hypothetical protein